MDYIGSITLGDSGRKIDGRSHMTRLLERLEHDANDGFD